MIARSAKTAVLAVLTVAMLGLALPQSAQARDHGRDSRSDGRDYGDQRDYRNRDDDRHHGSSRHHGWGNYRERYRYAPRYYPDVVVYPAPRVYYPAPYYAPVEPRYGYPSEYGTIGIHLDYNLLY